MTAVYINRQFSHYTGRVPSVTDEMVAAFEKLTAPTTYSPSLIEAIKGNIKRRAADIVAYVQQNPKKPTRKMIGVVATMLMVDPVQAAVNPAFQGDGYYLLAMVLVGFFSMIIVTFLKMSGRGDIAGLVFFVSGCVIIIDVVKVFKDAYNAIAGFVLN